MFSVSIVAHEHYSNFSASHLINTVIITDISKEM
jgi:hypothetical protein